MLFIPFVVDQKRNAQSGVRNGIGRVLLFSKLTAETFSEALEEMLTNKAYTERAKETARLFSDNLVHPMDEAMYWIEYVIRFKGAKHLKSYAVNMSWFSYLLLDVLMLPILFIVFIYILIKFLLRQTFNDTNSKEKRKYRKQKRE